MSHFLSAALEPKTNRLAACVLILFHRAYLVTKATEVHLVDRENR